MPLLVISPYAKRGFVDHTEGEFSSVLRFIEDNWGLPQLTERDRLATPMLSAFDFTAAPPPPRRAPQTNRLHGTRVSGDDACRVRCLEMSVPVTRTPEARSTGPAPGGWRGTIVACLMIAGALLSIAAADPHGDVAPCGAGVDAAGGSDVIDLDSATARVVEQGTAVEFRVRFARRPPAPDPAGAPWRVDLLLRDPTLPEYSFGYYRDVNRIVRYDAVPSPRVRILLLPERGENEYFAVHIEGRTLVMRLPGRLLVQDEDLAGVPLRRLRWNAISRDEGVCDRIGTGRPTRRIAGAASGVDFGDPHEPVPTMLPSASAVGRGGSGSWPWVAVAAGVLAVVAAATWLLRHRLRERGSTDRGPAGS